MKIGKYGSSSVFDSYLETMQRLARKRSAPNNITKIAGIDDLPALIKGLVSAAPDAALVLRVRGQPGITAAEYVVRYFSTGADTLPENARSLIHLKRAVGGIGSVKSVKLTESSSATIFETIRLLKPPLANPNAAEKVAVELAALRHANPDDINPAAVSKILDDAGVPSGRVDEVSDALTGTRSVETPPVVRDVDAPVEVTNIPGMEVGRTVKLSPEALSELDGRIVNIIVNNGGDASRLGPDAVKQIKDVVKAQTRSVKAHTTSSLKVVKSDIATMKTWIEEIKATGGASPELLAKLDGLDAQLVQQSSRLDELDSGLKGLGTGLDELATKTEVENILQEVTNIQARVGEDITSVRVDMVEGFADVGRRMDDVAARNADEVVQNRRLMAEMRDGFNKRLDEMADSIRSGARAGTASESALGLGRSWGWVKTGAKIVAGVALVAGVIYLWGEDIVNAIIGFFSDDEADRPFWVDRDPGFWVFAADEIEQCGPMVDEAVEAMSTLRFNTPDNQTEINEIRSSIAANRGAITQIVRYKGMRPEDITSEQGRATLQMLAELASSMSRFEYLVQEGGDALRGDSADPAAWDAAVASHAEASRCVERAAGAITSRLETMTGPAGSGPVEPRERRSLDPRVIFDPTVGITSTSRVALASPVEVYGTPITFVVIPGEARALRGVDLSTREVASGLSVYLNSSPGKAAIQSHMRRLKMNPALSGVREDYIVQYAANHAAFAALSNSGHTSWWKARDLSKEERDVEEALQERGAPGGGFFGLGYRDRRRKSERESARMEADRLMGVESMSKRKEELKKYALIAMDVDNNQQVSTNSRNIKRNIGKKADEHSRSYYKDALTGQSNNDQYMKSYYAGLKGMYDESLDKRKADYKEHFLLHDETGVDLIHEAHPKAIVVSDAIGRGGLVENGLEQKRQSHAVALSTPTGNYRANYAWLQDELLKK